MFRLIDHLERVLTVHDCVTVPGIGGFIVQYQSARIDDSIGMIMPPFRKVSFNASLSHNDGLLLESYMAVHDVDYPRASEMLSVDISELRERLTVHKVVSLGVLGKFNRSISGDLIFIPSDSPSILSRSLGLKPLSIPSFSDKIETASENPKYRSLTSSDLVYIPIHKKTIGAVVVAAMIAFLVLITPRQTLPDREFSASFVPTRPLQPISEIKRVVSDLQMKSVYYDESSKGHEILNQSEQKGKYFIIIGAFYTLSEAEKHFETIVNGSFPTAGILVSGNLQRIYASYYQDRDDAIRSLREVRKNEDFSSAWIYEVK